MNAPGALTPGDDLGVVMGTVRLVPYAERWPAVFETLRSQIGESLDGHGHVGTEHIGSTAVSGMTSKPLIDVMTGLARFETYESCIEPLESLGYRFMGEYGLPGRQFFILGEPVIAHLHLVQHDGHFWRLNLFFRELLRNDRAARERYLAVKRRLASEHADERAAYTAGKDAVIHALLREAGWQED